MNINYILLIFVIIGEGYANITVKGYDKFTIKESEETLSILDLILKYTKAIGNINISNLLYIYIYISFWCR